MSLLNNPPTASRATALRRIRRSIRIPFLFRILAGSSTHTDPLSLRATRPPLRRSSEDLSGNMRGNSIATAKIRRVDRAIRTIERFDPDESYAKRDKLPLSQRRSDLNTPRRAKRVGKTRKKTPFDLLAEGLQKKDSWHNWI